MEAISQNAEQSNFELPIRFVLMPSRIITATVCFMYIGAVVCVHFSGIPLSLKWIMSFILLFSLIYWYYIAVYRLERKPVDLLLNDKNEWYMSNPQGEMDLAELLPGAFVHNMLLVLTLRQGKFNRHIILFVDNLSRQTFRRLSTRLRFILLN